MTEFGNKNPFGKLRTVIMHRPGAEFNLLDEPDFWGFCGRPSREKSQKEFDSLVEILSEEKVDIYFIEPSDAPSVKLCFTRDLGIVGKNGIIMGGMTRKRRGEDLYIRVLAEELDIPIFGDVRNHYFEGGDLVFIKKNEAACGIGLTSYGGYELLEELVDFKLLPVPLRNQLVHLDSALHTSDGQIALTNPDILPKELLDYLNREEFTVLSVPLNEADLFSLEIISLDSNKVIVAEDMTVTQKLLEEEGVDVLTTTNHELRKGCAGLNSLIFPLLRK